MRTDLTHAAETIHAEGLCDTCPAPLDDEVADFVARRVEAIAVAADYEEIVSEAERESALLWWGIPVAAVLGAAWAYVEFGIPAVVACSGCL